MQKGAPRLNMGLGQVGSGSGGLFRVLLLSLLFLVIRICGRTFSLYVFAPPFQPLVQIHNDYISIYMPLIGLSTLSKTV